MSKYNTKRFVKWFEDEQQTFGTATALHNFIFLVADGLLGAVGSSISRVKRKKDARKRTS